MFIFSQAFEGGVILKKTIICAHFLQISDEIVKKQKNFNQKDYSIKQAKTIQSKKKFKIKIEKIRLGKPSNLIENSKIKK